MDRRIRIFIGIILASVLLIQAGVCEISLDGSDSVTVRCADGQAGQWYALLVYEGAQSTSVTDEEKLIYANQLQADENGGVSVTFVRADLPECAFFLGGHFQDDAASPRVIGRYVPRRDGKSTPSDLQYIEEEAFAGCAFENVVVGDKVTGIGKRAFADCTELQRISIPAATTEIAEDAFEGSGLLTIECARNSPAYQFAVDHGYTAVIID